jgi:hypothetical protein
MVSKGMLWLLAAAGLSLAASRLTPPIAAPIPNDPLELVTSRVRAVASSGKRADVAQLLDRARHSLALRSGSQGYDLKVRFTVDSGGQTGHDGAWKMEDIFDPKLGHRWTAGSSDSYTITRISSHGKLYGEETEDYVPLRLQEARAALFDAIPSAQNVASAAIRQSPAVFNGARLTCVLLSGSQVDARSIPGRRWDESEECIDGESGLVRMHSQVPGRYFLYDYSDAPRLGDHILPRKVTVTEAGRTVTTISVESLTELTSPDPGLFVPTEEMKAKGRAISMARAQKIWHVAGRGPAGAATHAVCVFGLVTPEGKLVEAHSLQPSDPNSNEAIEAAQQMTFAYPALLAPPPQQHFVFVIQEFGSSR